MSNPSAFDSDLFSTVDFQSGQTIQVRPFSIETDLHLLHGWMRLPHIAPFWQLDVPLEEFRRYLNRSLSNPSRRHYMVHVGKVPVSYAMSYRVHEDEIRHHYPYRETDLGGHFVVGPRSFLTVEAIPPIVRAMLRFIFQKENTDRIVVEPDVRNRIIIPALQKSGFYVYSRVQLPHKKACLMLCERQVFLDESHAEEV
ncbi:GNAT family N-acetyltransferase [Desmospora profundinema]|uniref:Lysine N-acyltransferase MbtK n=1 Tax=Desmospora profundinema TaxID=1571184 RepID=A0ABU1INR8_9BACL|nr:GNAT family N-acetyltransferase [Desmospora profundinema]MDR6226412.1 RimJ/RimL family protein N-acetyltransferase [Desmospora profundinema]